MSFTLATLKTKTYFVPKIIVLKFLIIFPWVSFLVLSVKKKPSWPTNLKDNINKKKLRKSSSSLSLSSTGKCINPIFFSSNSHRNYCALKFTKSPFKNSRSIIKCLSNPFQKNPKMKLKIYISSITFKSLLIFDSNISPKVSNRVVFHRSEFSKDWGSIT